VLPVRRVNQLALRVRLEVCFKCFTGEKIVSLRSNF